MRSVLRHTHRNESALIKKYRQAFEASKHLSSIDDKLLGYDNVIRFCARHKSCLEKQSVKRNQVLFWTYNNIGDLFLQKNLDHFEMLNFQNALSSYQNALEFSKDDEDQVEVLKKIRDIYDALGDENAAKGVSKEISEYIDDALKIDMFLHLANTSSNKTEESYFLEQALKYISDEKISFLKKCRGKLYICERLLQIYQKALQHSDTLRIEKIRNETKQLLN